MGWSQRRNWNCSGGSWVDCRNYREIPPLSSLGSIVLPFGILPLFSLQSCKIRMISDLFQETQLTGFCKNCATNFCISTWRQVGWKWHEIRTGNPIIFLEKAMEIPWIVNLSKIHVMFMHGKQLKPGYMTWNSHGIWGQFLPNCRQTVTRNVPVFLWECHIFYRVL